MTTIAAFEESRADNIININERVDSHRDEARRRIAALLDNPDQRNAEIVSQMLLSAFELDINEMGEQASEQYWVDVGDLMSVSFKKLHSIPVLDRGRTFSDAQSMMLLLANIQSYIETTAKDDMINGMLQAEEIKRQIKTMTRATLEQARTGLDIKGAVKRRGRK